MRDRRGIQGTKKGTQIYPTKIENYLRDLRRERGERDGRRWERQESQVSEEELGEAELARRFD